MSPLFLSFFAFVALLFCIFVWSQWTPSKRKKKANVPNLLLGTTRSHVNFMPQIRHALAAADNDFLIQKGGKLLAKQVMRERKTIALSYLAALQSDFEKLLQQAKLIAVLSPEVVAMHEFERVRLSLEFSLRCRWIRACIRFGSAPILQLSTLSDVVSGLTVRIEAAMRELAERTAAAAEFASPLNRRRIDSV